MMPRPTHITLHRQWTDVAPQDWVVNVAKIEEVNSPGITTQRTDPRLKGCVRLKDETVSVYESPEQVQQLIRGDVEVFAFRDHPPPDQS